MTLPAEAFTPRQLLAERGELVLWNSFLSWADTPLPLAPAGALARFWRTEAPAPGALAFELAAPGLTLLALPEAFPFAPFFRAPLDMADLPALPTALQQALGQGMVDMLWSALPDQRLGNGRILRFGPVETLLSRPVEWLRLEVAGLAPAMPQAGPVVFRIGVVLAELMPVLASGRIAAQAVDSALAARLEADADCVIGRLTLTLAEWAALAPGDVLVMPEWPGDEARLQIGDCCHRLRQEGRGWRYLGVETVAPAGSGTGPASPVAGLPVSVDFDLGRRALPIAMIRAWSPGTALALALPAPETGALVTLRVQGQVIGSGDLLLLDRRRAVRLTRLSAGNLAANAEAGAAAGVAA